MAENLKVGDVVQLKSGGPEMTIAYYEDDIKTYLCQWFRNGELKESSFTGESLIKVISPKDETQEN